MTENDRKSPEIRAKCRVARSGLGVNCVNFAKMIPLAAGASCAAGRQCAAKPDCPGEHSERVERPAPLSTCQSERRGAAITILPRTAALHAEGQGAMISREVPGAARFTLAAVRLAGDADPIADHLLAALAKPALSAIADGGLPD